MSMLDVKYKLQQHNEEIINLKRNISDLQISILRIQNDFLNHKNMGISVEPKYWAAFNKGSK